MFWLYFYEHWNFDLIPPNIGILILLLRYWPFLYKHWTYDLILGNVGILSLFLYTLEFLFYPCRSWYSRPIYSSKQWNSGSRFIRIGIMILVFQTFEFWPCFYTQWNFDLNLRNNGILALLL